MGLVLTSAMAHSQVGLIYLLLGFVPQPTYLSAILVLSAKPNKMAEDRAIPAEIYLELNKLFTLLKNLIIVIWDFRTIVFCRPIPSIKQVYLATCTLGQFV